MPRDDNAQKLKLELRAYTNISFHDLLGRLANVLRDTADAFGESDLRLEYAIDGIDSEPSVLESVGGVARLGTLNWRGRLTLAFGGACADRFSGGVQIHRYLKRDLGRVKKEGLKQHQLGLEVDRACYSGRHGPRLYRDLAVRIASGVEASYRCRFQRGGERPSFGTISEIGIGLPGIYWLNVLGPEFCGVVGKERLLGCRGFDIREINDGRQVLVQPCRDFPAADEARFREACSRLRSEIGTEYFAGERAPSQSNTITGKVGLLSFAKFLWLAKREYEDERHAAKRRPVFDLSRMAE